MLLVHLHPRLLLGIRGFGDLGNYCHFVLRVQVRPQLQVRESFYRSVDLVFRLQTLAVPEHPLVEGKRFVEVVRQRPPLLSVGVEAGVLKLQKQALSEIETFSLTSRCSDEVEFLVTLLRLQGLQFLCPAPDFTSGVKLGHYLFY